MVCKLLITAVTTPGATGTTGVINTVGVDVVNVWVTIVKDCVSKMVPSGVVPVGVNVAVAVNSPACVPPLVDACHVQTATRELVATDEQPSILVPAIVKSTLPSTDVVAVSVTEFDVRSLFASERVGVGAASATIK